MNMIAEKALTRHARIFEAQTQRIRPTQDWACAELLQSIRLRRRLATDDAKK